MTHEEAMAKQERMIRDFASLVRDGVRDGLELSSIDYCISPVVHPDGRATVSFDCRARWEEPRRPRQDDPDAPTDAPQVVYPSPD